MIKKKTMLFIYGFLFLFIYSPHWIGGFDYVFNTNFWSWFCLLLFIPRLLDIKNEHTFIYSQKVKKYFTCIVSATIYYCFIHIAFMSEFTLKSTRIIQNLFPIISLLVLITIVDKLRKMDFSSIDGIKVLINLASIQGVLCLLMVLIPSLKNIANQLFLNTSYFKEGDYILSTRIYGISSDYTYGFPIVHGLLSGISLYIGLKYDKKYIFNTFLIILSVILNGRTGLLIAIITILLSLVMTFELNRVSIRKLRLIIVLPIIIIIGMKLLQLYLPFVYKFSTSLFTQLYTRNDTVEYLTKSNLFFPNGLYFFFGEGHTVYGSEAARLGYLASDIGFVNDMYMGGVVFTIIRYTAVFHLIITKPYNRFEHYLIIVTALAWIIANYKGQATANSMLIITIQFLSLCRIQLKKEVNKSEKSK